MAPTEDLIDFDIIETHKENIQSLPGGRSAKALVAAFAPPSLLSSSPTPGSTRNLNDAVREEYELEIIAIVDSDDPLDIYDRYVKWTLNAYPSSQATPESQLRPLLERATKAFLAAPHYKNDPRYLKLWLTYIRLFSDAPKESFAYLARHNIGENLALFYEEFAAWLEGAGRWTQADEVYKLGIEREARPTERLNRKFGEFQHRLEHRVQNAEEPSSPALPTVRPALVTKIDPFALSTPRPTDPQAQRPSLGIGGGSTSRSGKQKLAIFSDSGASVASNLASTNETAKGWENIGSIAERKKENVMEARPWAGETLKTGKKSNAPPKMSIFKDEPSLQVPDINQIEQMNYSDRQQITNPRTGKVERVFVNLEAVYPNPNDPNEEMSFEELRAKARGWLHRDWAAEISPKKEHELQRQVEPQESVEHKPVTDEEHSPEHKVSDIRIENVTEEELGVKNERPKKMKIREVKAEVQTIKTNLESPTGPKLRRKISAEPTMTLHTKAATDDILDIFNQPLKNVGLVSSQAESAGESDYEDDDYTSAGESTGTGRISAPSEFGDDEPNTQALTTHDEIEVTGASPWSDFTASKHVPRVDLENMTKGEVEDEQDEHDFVVLEDDTAVTHHDDDIDIVTPVSPTFGHEAPRTKFIPLPPDDYEPPNRPFRDPSQALQNRLPFMTPIVEKTESSMGALTIREEKDYFNSKTPSRGNSKGLGILETQDELLSSPFQEIINEARVINVKSQSPPNPKMKTISTVPETSRPTGPVIKDAQCNPIYEGIRTTILDNLQPPLSCYEGFSDHRPQTFNKGPEIRRFIKALAKVSKNGADKTGNVSLPPTLKFPSLPAYTYTVKRELGKGAFAPVYLVQQDEDGEEPKTTNASTQLLALKCEQPPTPWEFYIMSTLHSRLPTLPSSRYSDSLLKPQALCLFADEGYLIEQYIDQGTLLDLVNIAKSDSAGVLDEVISMFFTVELLRAVEAMHSVGILHGDLKADNCLVRLLPSSSPSLSSSLSSSSADYWDSEYQPSGTGGWSAKGLCLIDFGRGIDMRHFKPDVQFIADWKTGKADCAEMREMRPWTWQVDYWGMAGVAHSLLFGKYIEDVAVDLSSRDGAAAIGNDGGSSGGGGLLGVAAARKWKLKEALKRYWQTELWTALFDVLLNPAGYAAREEDSGKMPVMKTLRRCREDMEAWLEREAGRRGLKAGLRRLEEKIRERRGRAGC